MFLLLYILLIQNYRVDGFHYYLGYIKFGIGRTSSDAAHEIRDEKITREEGVALVEKFDGEFPDVGPMRRRLAGPAQDDNTHISRSVSHMTHFV